MRLRLQPDSDMLDWTGYHRIGHTGERTGTVVLCIAQLLALVQDLELALCETETTELHGDAGADAEEWGESSFVEGECALVLVDGRGGDDGVGVGGGGLEADFDDIKWLTWCV